MSNGAMSPHGTGRRHGILFWVLVLGGAIEIATLGVAAFQQNAQFLAIAAGVFLVAAVLVLVVQYGRSLGLQAWSAVAVLAASAFVLGLLFPYSGGKGPNSTARTEESPGQTASPTNSPGDDPVTPTTVSPTRTTKPSEPPSSEPENTRTEIQLEEAVHQERCRPPNTTGSSWDDMAVRFGTDPIVDQGFGCELRSTRHKGYVDFEVPPKATTLVGLTGIEHRSPNSSVRAEVTIVPDPDPGGPLFKEIVGYNRPTPIEADITGIGRIRIHVRVADYDADPADQSATIAFAKMAFEQRTR